MRLFLCTLVLSKSRYDIAHNSTFSVNTFFFFLNCSSYWVEVEKVEKIQTCTQCQESRNTKKCLL